MTKYVINEDASNEYEVEASDFQKVDDYFFFYQGSEQAIVFVISADNVGTIRVAKAS